MDRDTRKRLRSHTDPEDWAIQRAVRLRAERRVTTIATPTLPATGTDRISALLAEARRDRNEAWAATRRRPPLEPGTEERPSGP